MPESHPTIAYAVLYRNDDGSLEPGPLCKSPECAVQSVGIFSGRTVFGLTTVELAPITGMHFVLREIGPSAKPVTLGGKFDEAAIERAVRAHDREDAAQKGEPDPWADDFPEPYRSERMTSMRVAIAALAAQPQGDAS